MKLSLTCSILCLLLLLPTTGAFAHGGAYRGPGPGVRSPRDPTPGGLPPAGTPWPVTWGLNREQLLNLRKLQIERTRSATSRRRGFFFGPTAGEGKEDPARERARDRIVTSLLKATGDKNADVATGAVIALGKSRSPRAASTLMKLVGNRRADKTVRESAALALGMLATGDPGIRNFLADVAANPAEERRTRAFAALGLGFNGDIGAVPALMARARAKESNRDVPACATLALGLLGDEIVVPDLSRSLSGRPDRRTKDDILRAYDAAALGLLRSRAALPALLRALVDKKLEVRQQAVLTLGALARPEDKAVVQNLTRLLQTDRNVAVKAFAAYALGEIGHPKSEVALLHAYRFGESFVPHYCVLGLAILGRRAEDAALRERIATFLRGEFRRRAGNDLRGALAVAVGVIGDQPSAKDLVKLVDSGGDPMLRAHAVLSLGLLDHREALPLLRRLLKERSSPVLVREAALTLGVMGDTDAEKILLRLVREGSSEYVRGSAAVSLGRLASPETAMALLDLLEDRQATDMARAFAAVALGLALDREPVPVLSKLGDHLNHYMVVEALREALTLL